MLSITITKKIVLIIFLSSTFLESMQSARIKYDGVKILDIQYNWFQMSAVLYAIVGSTYCAYEFKKSNPDSAFAWGSIAVVGTGILAIVKTLKHKAIKELPKINIPLEILACYKERLESQEKKYLIPKKIAHEINRRSERVLELKKISEEIENIFEYYRLPAEISVLIYKYIEHHTQEEHLELKQLHMNIYELKQMLEYSNGPIDEIGAVGKIHTCGKKRKGIVHYKNGLKQRNRITTEFVKLANPELLCVCKNTN